MRNGESAVYGNAHMHEGMGPLQKAAAAASCKLPCG